jgi:putative FmdB family regulatory protein
VPRYDYACHDCDHRFEAVHPITSEALSVCPECGGTLRRVIGAVGVSFKGSGFYRTDSREAARKGRAKATGRGSSTTPSAATPSTASEQSSPAVPSAEPATKPATTAAAKTPAAPSSSDS